MNIVHMTVQAGFTNKIESHNVVCKSNQMYCFALSKNIHYVNFKILE